MASTSARKSAALSTAIDVEFEGETYSIPPAEEWSLDVLEAFEDGKVATMVRSLVGPAQYATFRSVPRTTKDLGRFVEAIQGALGLGN